MMADLSHLDNQMEQWASRLRDDLRIAPPASNQLASNIMREIAVLDEPFRKSLRDDSPIPFQARLDELRAFQAWMDISSGIRNNPVVTRAQVITQNYVCFVYLGDAWFKKLRQVMPSASVTKNCCKFLTDNPVRIFRNAVAHANWKYKDDFSGLEFWGRPGEDRSAPMSRYEVSQNELNFWQSLARCAAYASFIAVADTA